MKIVIHGNHSLPWSRVAHHDYVIEELKGIGGVRAKIKEVPIKRNGKTEIHHWIIVGFARHARDHYYKNKEAAVHAVVERLGWEKTYYKHGLKGVSA